MQSEAELVRECLAGSASALEKLVRLLEPDLFAVCLKLLRHRQDAEDVAQESLVRAVRYLGKFDPTLRLKAWALGIAVNRCRTALARRKTRPAELYFEAELPARPEAPVEADLAAAVEAAVARLRPEHREAFVLFHTHALSYEEVSAALDLPPGTVKTWIYRARQQLAADLKQAGHLPDPDRAEAR